MRNEGAEMNSRRLRILHSASEEHSLSSPFVVRVFRIFGGFNRRIYV